MKRQFLLMTGCLTIALTGCAHHYRHDPWGPYASVSDPYGLQVGIYDEAVPPQYLPALYPGDTLAGRRLAKRKSRRHRHSTYDQTPFPAYGQPYGYGMPGPYGMLPPMLTSVGDACSPCGCEPEIAWSSGFAPGHHPPMLQASGAECCGTEMVIPSCAAPVMQIPDCAVPGMYHSAPSPQFAPDQNQHVVPGPMPSPDAELQEFRSPDSEPNTTMRDGLAPLPPLVHGAVWSAPPVPPVPVSAQSQQYHQPGGRVMSRQMIAAPEAAR